MFLTRAVPQKDAQGGVLQWFGTNTDITERKQAEAALANSERSLAEAQHIGRIGSWEWNIETGEVSWSPELYSLYQVDPDTFVPSIQAFGDFIHPDDRDYVDGIIGQILSGIAPGDFDFRIVLADGSTRYINTTGQLTEYDEAGRPRLMVGVNQDVTERKRVEQTLLRLNRTLAAHSASDQALVRARDESSYLEEVCRIVVEVCGHAMVWIGYKQDNDDSSVRPVASAGFEEGYLETLNITWADSERGRGPTGTAVRTGRPSKCPNMLTDPTFAPWREEAARRGYASSVALPLLESETAFGAITIYSSEPDPFSDDEVKLLADLTEDLALGINTLRLQTAHAEAERERDILLAEEQHLTEELQAINEELQAQTEELQVQTEELAARERQLREQNEELLASRYNRTLIEASLDPLVTIGLDGTITDVNEAAVKIRGYSREEIIGTDFSDYFTDPQKARLGYQEAFARGSVTDYPLTIRSRDGRLTDVLYNATVYRDESGKVQGVFAAARDITAIKELEVQREIASTLQGALLDIPEETSLVMFSHLYRSATRDASVGGDFYDVFKVKDNRMAVLIGDVCGHGVEAARVAILVKDVVHAFAHQFSQPEMVLTKTNDLLLEKRIHGFFTVFLGFLDPDTGVLEYSSAGHPPAVLRTAEGGVEELAAGSPPVGVFPGHSWKAGQVQLHKGDLLLLYTDGLIEARRNGDFFGQEGLVKLLTHWKNPSPELLPQALLDEVLSFSGGALSDDVAMLALSLRDIAGEGSERAFRQEKPLE
jgi:PAS domain S-box-containing protein